ncbi:MAG TPA: hypothetical protein VFF24_12435 [Acidimicrobiia bacterium]|nr:hypothetical protein [Acidimicrobiia bacterium]
MIRTVRWVNDCRTAEPERPSLLFVAFLSWEETSRWTFAEVREAIVGAGGSPAYLDRLGVEQWTALSDGFVTLSGERQVLQQVAERLNALPLEARSRWISPTLRCAYEIAEGKFLPDQFSVKLRQGADVAALLARHGNLETETRRWAPQGKPYFYLSLTTTRPTRLFQRVVEWWNDPEVILAEYDGVVRAGESMSQKPG